MGTVLLERSEGRSTRRSLAIHDKMVQEKQPIPTNSSDTRVASWVVLAVLVGIAGCQTAPHAPDQTTVAAHLAQRVGQTLPSQTVSGQIALPPGASLDDGITEDESVAIALWNNAAFQELLVDLGIARGDLIQAGLLPNPEFVYFFGVTDKPFKYAFELPIEAIWLRPIRIQSAAREADRTADRLAQAGLDLMRDVRQAYADVVLAKERVRVAGEAVKLRGRIAELAEKRLTAGDISPQEAATARIDALQAQQDAARIGYEVPVAEERLRNLLGIGPLRGPLPLDPTPPPSCREFDVDALTQEDDHTSGRPRRGPGGRRGRGSTQVGQNRMGTVARDRGRHKRSGSWA